nr:MAG TPA: hypothetical protein [Caudoviricetes sp.]
MDDEPMKHHGNAAKIILKNKIRYDTMKTH